MKKQFMIGLMALGMAVLFSGCSIASKACNFNETPAMYQNTNTEVATFYVEGELESRTPSAARNTYTRNIHLLQNAAHLTLENGYSFFAFAHPKGEANNKEGSMINTAEEFIEKCTPSALKILNTGQNCGWATNNVNAKAIIYTFKERPSEMFTYDAAEVKHYLTENKLWRKDGIDIYSSNCTERFLKYRTAKE
ncbi:MAG: hypothetical protein IBX45_12720 [Campylobacterales bacterium]|nr:hypothetical protein [Campylobacterales bacterium]